MLVGNEITRQDSQSLRNTAFFNNLTTSVTVPASNPISMAPVTFRQSASDADNHSSVRVYAGYLQDQADITDYLQLVGGIRVDSFDIAFHDNRTGSDLGRTDVLASPRAGVIVKPQDDMSLYFSYSVSHLPSSGDQFATLTAQSQGLIPERLENYEVGAKWDITPSLNTTVAIYQLDRTNTSATDPNNPTQFVSTGSSQTRGIEIGATGRITDTWEMIGGYTFQDARITTTTTAAQAGRRAALVPENMLSLWNKYDVTSAWSAAAGIIYQSSQFAALDNAVRLPGYTRFDAAVFYNFTPDYRLQLNIENILDRKYTQTAHNNNNIQPGTPLTFRATLAANF
jgi:catecholate siderophore receptor